MMFQSKVAKAVLLFSSLLLADASCAAADNSGQNAYWAQVKTLVVRCSVQTYTINGGAKVYGPLKSVCSDVQVKGQQARYRLNGEWFMATMVDSDDSDGGDLNDIFVKDQNGNTYAERHNIAAFRDVLLGLAGGAVQLPEQYVQELDTN